MLYPHRGKSGAEKSDSEKSGAEKAGDKYRK